MNVLDQIFLFVGGGLAISFVVLSVFKGEFRRYLYLNLYTIAMVAVSVAQAVLARVLGIRSTEYFFVYYGTDFCLVMLKYAVIVSFFEIILRDSPLRTQARMAFLFFFAIVAAMSYGFISNQVISNITIFYKKLLVEFQQNMYFAGVVMVAMLCISLAHLRVKDPQIRMLVCALGVSGALQACGWAVQNLVPKSMFHNLWGITRLLSPLATTAMLALWCYAIARIKPLKTSAEDEAIEITDVPLHEHAMMFASTMSKVEARG